MLRAAILFFGILVVFGLTVIGPAIVQHSKRPADKDTDES